MLLPPPPPPLLLMLQMLQPPLILLLLQHLHLDQVAFFDHPDFPLHELAERLPLYTLPTIPKCNPEDFWQTKGLNLASSGLGGLAHLEFQRKCLELIVKSTPSSMFSEPFSDLLTVIKRICASPSKEFDKVETIFLP